jgi:hypothetical protein
MTTAKPSGFWRATGRGVAHTLIVALGLAGQVAFNLLPRWMDPALKPGESNFALLTILALAAGSLALISLGLERAETKKQIAGIVVLAFFLVTLSYSQGLEVGEWMRDAQAAKVKTRQDERADLQRRIEQLRERKWRPLPEPTTQAMVDAAQRALEIAAENRKAECAAQNGGHGKNCQRDKATEKAALEKLNKLVAGKTAFDEAKATDDQIERLEKELLEKRAPVQVDPHMAALAKPLGLFIPLDKENPAASVGDWWPHYIALTMEVMTVGLPMLFRIVLFGRGRRPRTNDKARQQMPVAVPQVAPRRDPGPLRQLLVAAPATPAAMPPITESPMSLAPPPCAAFATPPEPECDAEPAQGAMPSATPLRGPAVAAENANQINCDASAPPPCDASSSQSAPPPCDACALPPCDTSGPPRHAPVPPVPRLPVAQGGASIAGGAGDSVRVWFDACATLEPNGRVRCKDGAYQHYENWCAKEGIEPENFANFNRRVKAFPEVGFDKGKNNRGRAYLGFTLVAVAPGRRPANHRAWGTGDGGRVEIMACIVDPRRTRSPPL